MSPAPDHSGDSERRRQAAKALLHAASAVESDPRKALAFCLLGGTLLRQLVDLEGSQVPEKVVAC